MCALSFAFGPAQPPAPFYLSFYLSMPMPMPVSMSGPTPLSAPSAATPYQPARPASCEFVTLRALRHHLRRWDARQPATDAPPTVLLHGWMDVGASWQFVVDALSQGFAEGRTLLAPDWRGFGLTRPVPAPDSYAFHDYLGDLDQLLAHCFGDQPVDLVGHSMGGNIAMLYAGVRPKRVRRLVNLEGFGMPATQPAQAAPRLAQWLDAIAALPGGALALKTYDSADSVAQRLVKTNPRLAPDKAAWLARHWAAPDADGRWHILGDAAHKVPSASLYRVDETLAIHSAISAPVLAIEADSNSPEQWWKGRYSLAQYHERLKVVPDCRTAVVQHAGHMLHHDQPQALAQLIEAFLR